MPVRYCLTDAALAAGIDPPCVAYADDAGIDLRSLQSVRLMPGSVTEVRTGIIFEIPKGFFGLICNRTSMAKRGLLPLGHVVDAGFVGELILILHNINSAEAIDLKSNERIAQMVVMPIYRGKLRRIALEKIKKSERGARRLGSSGAF